MSNIAKITPVESSFLEETVRVLADNNKTVDDIQWIGLRDKASFPIDSALSFMNTFTYDGGYGWEYINRGFVIVGDGWWLERGEYDGSEWWEFKQTPTVPDKEESDMSNMLAKHGRDEITFFPVAEEPEEVDHSPCYGCSATHCRYCLIWLAKNGLN